MEVNRINEVAAAVSSAKVSLKYLISSGKLTGAQFVAYCDLMDEVKELQETFQKYCEDEL
jgi:hypothetical protein